MSANLKRVLGGDTYAAGGNGDGSVLAALTHFPKSDPYFQQDDLIFYTGRDLLGQSKLSAVSVATMRATHEHDNI